jgi:hypothetical protein
LLERLVLKDVASKPLSRNDPTVLFACEGCAYALNLIAGIPEGFQQLQNRLLSIFRAMECIIADSSGISLLLKSRRCVSRTIPFIKGCCRLDLKTLSEPQAQEVHSQLAGGNHVEGKWHF